MATIDLSTLVTAADRLEQARKRKRQQITQDCQAAIDGGFLYASHWFDSDPRSQTNIIGTANAVGAGIPLPEGFTWRTADNADVPMGGAGVIALGAALLARVNEQYARSWQLKAQIDAAETAQQVEAVNW